MNIGIDFEKFQQRDSVQVMTNYTKMPNTIIDDCIMAQISDKAFKCLMFVMRQTVGFSRASHTIAITQFQKYCGIKKRDTVMAAIRELEQCKLITVERKTGCLNEYFLTLSQYHQTGLVPLEGSTTKRDGTSTAKGDYTSPVERGTIKETLKENFKEGSSNSEKPFFEAQKNVLAGYVTYFSNDPKYYSLHELELTYAVGSDFINQAQASHPSLELSIDHFSQMFDDMRQWSLTPNSGTKQPQQWMNTWLKWVKNNSYKFTAKPKNQPQTNQTKPKQQREQAWADYYSKRNQQQSNIIDVIEVQHD